jgi:hypothetical protein
MSTKPTRPRQMSVGVEWEVGDFTPTYYATNIVTQFTDHEFLLSFFELFPPLLVGTPEEIAAQAEQVETVKAQCLARVVIAADRMAGFVDALQGIVEQYQARNLDDSEE